MRAFGASMSQGPTLLGERRNEPYTIGAPSIAEVEITGEGVITDLVWLAASDIEKFGFESRQLWDAPAAILDDIGRAVRDYVDRQVDAVQKTIFPFHRL